MTEIATGTLPARPPPADRSDGAAPPLEPDIGKPPAHYGRSWKQLCRWCLETDPVPAPAVGRGLSPSAPARSTPAPRADAEAPSLGGAGGGGNRRDHRRDPPGGTRSRGLTSRRRGRLRERDGGRGSRWDRRPRRHRAPGVAGPPRAHPQPNGATSSGTLGTDVAAPVDESTGREIAKRAGARTLLAGSVRRMGELIVVELRGIDPDRGEYLLSDREQAQGKSEVLALVDRLAARARKKLVGDRGPSTGATPVAQLVTANLEANRQYATGKVARGAESRGRAGGLSQGDRARPGVRARPLRARRRGFSCESAGRRARGDRHRRDPGRRPCALARGTARSERGTRRWSNAWTTPGRCTRRCWSASGRQGSPRLGRVRGGFARGGARVPAAGAAGRPHVRPGPASESSGRCAISYAERSCVPLARTWLAQPPAPGRAEAAAMAFAAAGELDDALEAARREDLLSPGRPTLEWDSHGPPRVPRGRAGGTGANRAVRPGPVAARECARPSGAEAGGARGPGGRRASRRDGRLCEPLDRLRRRPGRRAPRMDP